MITWNKVFQDQIRPWGFANQGHQCDISCRTSPSVSEGGPQDSPHIFNHNILCFFRSPPGIFQNASVQEKLQGPNIYQTGKKEQNTERGRRRKNSQLPNNSMAEYVVLFSISLNHNIEMYYFCNKKIHNIYLKRILSNLRFS